MGVQPVPTDYEGGSPHDGGEASEKYCWAFDCAFSPNFGERVVFRAIGKAGSKIPVYVIESWRVERMAERGTYRGNVNVYERVSENPADKPKGWKNVGTWWYDDPDEAVEVARSIESARDLPPREGDTRIDRWHFGVRSLNEDGTVSTVRNPEGIVAHGWPTLDAALDWLDGLDAPNHEVFRYRCGGETVCVSCLQRGAVDREATELPVVDREKVVGGKTR